MKKLTFITAHGTFCGVTCNLVMIVKKTHLDFILQLQYLLAMKNNIQKVTPGFVFLYLAVLLVAPLFHLHVDEDHQNVNGETYHSHSLPIDVPFSEQDESGLPSGDDLQLLQKIPQLSRIHNLALECQLLPVVFLSYLNIETLLSQDRNNLTSQKNSPPNILSPQWGNYILYATSISPPLA